MIDIICKLRDKIAVHKTVLEAKQKIVERLDKENKDTLISIAKMEVEIAIIKGSRYV